VWWEPAGRGCECGGAYLVTLWDTSSTRAARQIWVNGIPDKGRNRNYCTVTNSSPGGGGFQGVFPRRSRLHGGGNVGGIQVEKKILRRGRTRATTEDIVNVVL
jgi:hypothetical protein